MLGDVARPGRARARLRRRAVVGRARRARRARASASTCRARSSRHARGPRRDAAARAGRAASSCRSPTRAFDVVFCDHGALSFCDPDVDACPRSRALLRARRPARVLLHAPAAVPHVGRRQRAADAQAAARLRRPRPHGARRGHDRLGAAARATGSACCAPTASRSRTSSSCGRRRTRRRPTTTSRRRSGRGAGRPSGSGRRAAR